MAKRERNHFVFLGIQWFHFHLSSLSRVLITLPVIPSHTVIIEAVQVRKLTGLVPPGSLECLSTVCRIDVVILIFGGERHTMMN